MSSDLEARVKQLESWMADLHPEAQKRRAERIEAEASGSEVPKI